MSGPTVLVNFCSRDIQDLLQFGTERKLRSQTERKVALFAEETALSMLLLSKKEQEKEDDDQKKKKKRKRRQESESL
jgi:hypothetical protein